jgi:hypothetical protein
MIRFWPENIEPGNMMLVEKAKGQAMSETFMPETTVPETVKPGKIIAHKERGTPHKRHHREDTREVHRLHPTGTMKPILDGNGQKDTGTLWGNEWEKDACQIKMHNIVWTGCTCPN